MGSEMCIRDSATQVRSSMQNDGEPSARSGAHCWADSQILRPTGERTEWHAGGVTDERLGWFAPHPEGLMTGHPFRAEVGDDGDVLHAGSAAAVVELGAACGLRESSSRTSDGTVHYWVCEFAVLADGRRIVLHEERGFSIGPTIGPGEQHLGRDEIIRTVLNVVLPDDEQPEEAHPFDWLASLAAKRGLHVTADELRSLPYEVALSAEVEALYE